MKNILKSIVVLLGGITIGALLLALVYMLPVSEESANVVASMQILNTEGWYPTLPLVEGFSGAISRTNAGGILDNFTDSIMITTAAKDAGSRPWYQAMQMESSMMGSGYSYYWHGYVAILRPLLLLVDYGEIRVLNHMLQMLTVILIFVQIKKRKGIVWAMLSLSVYGLLCPMALAFSLQYSWVFYITSLITILMLRFEEKWRIHNRIFLLFLVSGMLTSYMDLLTYPLITWGIPMVWWIVLDDGSNKEFQRLKEVVLGGISWIFGYGGMWIGKWLLGELFLQESVAAAAWNEVLVRSGMQTGSEGYGVGHWETILRNFVQCNNIQIICILGLWFLWFGYIVCRIKFQTETKKSPAYLLIAASPFVWYIVLHNHTFVHAMFTYRICIVFFVAVLAGMITILEKQQEQLQKGWTVKWQRISGGIVLSLALLISLTERESIWTHNGHQEGVRLEIHAGESIIQEFVPAYNYIENIQLGIGAEGDLDGQFVVRLCCGEDILAEKQIPTSVVGDSGFFEIAFNTKVKRGERYNLYVELVDNKNTAGWIYVTPEGNYALSEFDAVSVDGLRYDRQLIGGFTYNKLVNKSKVLLNFLTLVPAIGVFAACIGNTLKVYKKK